MFNSPKKLKKIILSGYKSYSNSFDTEVEFKNVNVIIGANGAGKSNLISFFDMLGFMTTNAFQDWVSRNGQPQSILYCGIKTTDTIHAKIVFEDDEDIDSYEFKLVYALNEKLVFGGEEFKWHNKGKYQIPLQFTVPAGGLESYLSNIDTSISERNSKMTSVIRNILRSCSVYHFNDTSYTSRLRQSSYIDSNGYLMSDGGNLAAFLYRIKNDPNTSNYYNRILKYARAALPQLKDFVLEPDYRTGNYVKLNWISQGSDELFGPHQLSDGSLRFFALITALLQPLEMSPSVIILDEPEIGLHPHAVSLLANIIKMIGTEKQVIISTQSATLLDEFDCGDVIVAEFDRDKKSSKLERLDEKSYESWLEDYTLSDLWSKNVFGGLPL